MMLCIFCEVYEITSFCMEMQWIVFRQKGDKQLFIEKYYKVKIESW